MIHFDCILLDLHMAGLDGFTVLELLARRKSKVPVVVITGHDQPGTGERVSRLGARAYMTKPVEEDPLMRVIAKSMSQG